MTKPQTTYLPTNLRSEYQFPTFPKGFWATLSKEIPKEYLSGETSENLRKEVAECCSWLIREEINLEKSLTFSKGMQRHGANEPAQYEKFAKTLRKAADIWENDNIRKFYHDDRLGEFSQFDKLKSMADAAQSHLDGLKTLQPQFTKSLLPEFARRIKNVFYKAGIKPECTGHIYDKSNPLKSGKTTKGGAPTWFQKFMLSLMTGFIDKEANRLKLIGLGRHSPESFYMMIAQAESGRLLKTRKAGK